MIQQDGLVLAQKLIVFISSQVHTWWLQVASSKLAVVEIFTSWKSANVTNLGFVLFCCWREPAVKHFPAYCCSPLWQKCDPSQLWINFPSISFSGEELLHPKVFSIVHASGKKPISSSICPPWHPLTCSYNTIYSSSDLSLPWWKPPKYLHSTPSSNFCTPIYLPPTFSHPISAQLSQRIGHCGIFVMLFLVREVQFQMDYLRLFWTRHDLSQPVSCCYMTSGVWRNAGPCHFLRHFLEDEAHLSIVQIAKYVKGVDSSALGLCLKWFMGQCPISVIYNSLAVSLTLTLSSHPKECFDVPTLHGELWAWGRKQRS